MRPLRYLSFFVLFWSLDWQKIQKFASIDCDTFNETIIINLCEISDSGTIEVSFNLLQPTTEVFVSLRSKVTVFISLLVFKITFTSKVKSGNTYRQLYQTPMFDYCAFRSGAVVNPKFKTLIDQLKSGSKVFHACPYNGSVEIRKFDVKDHKFFFIYPAGIYRVIVAIYNQAGLPFLVFTIGTSIISPNAFG